MNNTIEQIMSFPELPHYLTIVKVVDKEKDLVTILVRSTIHVDKEIRLPMQYSIAYTQEKPAYVAGDILSAVIKRYGLTKNPVRYT